MTEKDKYLVDKSHEQIRVKVKSIFDNDEFMTIEHCHKLGYVGSKNTVYRLIKGFAGSTHLAKVVQIGVYLGCELQMLDQDEIKVLDEFRKGRK